MIEARLSAASGIINQQRRVDTIADNIANANTVGFKSSRLNFKDMLYVDGKYPYEDTALNNQKGHGVMTASISRNFATGSLSTTGRDLDFAIEGEGFFSILAPDGNTYYSRAGNFYLSEVGGQMYLVDARGHFVLDDDGAPITLPDGANSLTVDERGQITFTGPNGFTQDGGQMGIRTFTNPDGLSADGSSYYEPTVASGDPQTSENFRLHQDTLEMSNVDISQEMTRLIRAQRAFQLASRALTTADDMDGIANNMRK